MTSWRLQIRRIPQLLLFSCRVTSHFATSWTTAHQVSLSFTVSWSLLRFMFVELVIISNHLILSSFPASGSSLLSQLFASGGQNIGASASASVLPMSISGWFPLGLTCLISLPSKGLSRYMMLIHHVLLIRLRGVLMIKKVANHWDRQCSHSFLL